MFLKIFLNIFICCITILFQFTYEKHLSYSNNAPLIGHINFITPISDLIHNHILVSSFNGNVALLNYKTGKFKYVKNHRENEKVKKIVGYEKYAVALIYKDNSEKDIYGNYINDNDTYSYIIAYDIISSHLLSIFNYKDEIIKDFIVTNGNIIILFDSRVDIGDIDTNTIRSFFFTNINSNSISSKIISIEGNIMTLLYIDTNFFCHIVTINTLNKNDMNSIKVEELQLNNNVNYYINVYNKNLVILYNKKYMYWIELTNTEKKYDYNYVAINDKDEETIFKNEVVENGKFIKEDEAEQWNADNHIIIDTTEHKLVYHYYNKKMNLIKKIETNEIVGYYINKNNQKEMIIASDLNNKIVIKKINEIKNEKALNILNKNYNVYYNGELIVGIYNTEEDANYYFSVYNDSSFTVYKENDILYLREESLAYIEQLYFYNFKHKKNNNKKNPYKMQFQLLKEFKKYTKDKISLITNPLLDEIIKKEDDLSLLPFNFFYLSAKEKEDLLDIYSNKKVKSDFNNGGESSGGAYKYTLMQSLLNKSFKNFSLHQSSKYSRSSIVVVSTCNKLIFAFHLFTGLILYKINGNQFSSLGISSLRKSVCSISMSNNNWSEIDNGKKIIFSNDIKHDKGITNNGNIITKLNRELSLFKKFQKESLISIFKSNNNSFIFIFDILNGNIWFEKKIESFLIQHYFILNKSSSIIVIDNLLNIKVINVLNKEMDEDINEMQLFFYNINTSQNCVEGYKLISQLNNENKEHNIGLIKTYLININNEKIEVFSKSIKKKNLFFPIKIDKQTSISYKYINDNVISYVTKTQHKSNVSYILYIIDGISGSLIFSKILDKYAKPPFHLVINEHYVILNYYNENLHKYVFFIIEMLLDKKDPGILHIITSKKEKYVDLFAEQKILINEKNYIIDHNVKSFNFTDTKRGITNKHLLLLLDTNKIVSLNISEEKNNNLYVYLNTFITQTDILYNSKGFISNESLLESTTLLFSWGNNLYFTNYQPNGPFDTIENFNYLLLLFFIILVYIGTYYSYKKRIEKKLYMNWA